ncbi:MAG: trypsin-like peptidase domain-containing protein [Ruminococcus sp.]|nr:trypsin-like peptidase domain-containing protein [Ruminococcus sp.]
MQKINSFSEFARFSGRCFVRALGVSPHSAEEIQQMDISCTDKMRRGFGFYTRISSLPNILSAVDTEYYTKSYINWLSSERKKLSIKCTETENLSLRLGKALDKTVKLFTENHSAVNESIIKNFAVKLLFRTDFVLKGINSGDVRIVAQNVIKIQEYLLFYMLYEAGFSVLLVQDKCDVAICSSLLELSDKFIVGEFGKYSVPAYNPDCTAQSSSGISENSNIKIVLPERKSRNIIKTSDGQHKAEQNKVSRCEKTFEELARLASSIVMIAVCDRFGNIKSSGSGIMIGRNGYILTNNHVASGGLRYAVRIEEEEKIYETDEVIKYNPMFDLALIRIQRKLSPVPVYQGKTRLVRGQRVVAIGSPMGLFNSVSDGIISGFRNIHDTEMIQFTAPISHGSSGGAVLNMYGEVIGISTAGIDEGQNLNLAVSYEHINHFIRGFV